MVIGIIGAMEEEVAVLKQEMQIEETLEYASLRTSQKQGTKNKHISMEIRLSL